MFCVFVVENQQIKQNILAMITEDKITELFCVADNFCKEFEAEIEKTLFYRQPMAEKGAYYMVSH